MPEFLDAFSGEIERKRDRFRGLLSWGVSSPLDEDLRALMQKNWHSFSSFDVVAGGVGLPKAIAVDASMARRFLAVGSTFYVVRSLALCGRRRFRRLESDVFASRADVRDIARYVGLRSEWVEHRVAREAVEAEDGCRFLFVDGSFHGRLMAVPRDTPHEGQRGFMIDYFREYSELLEACRERGVIPVGVSKDSRVTLLRDYFLSVLLSEELKRLGLSVEDGREITETFRSILHRRRGQRVRRFRLLESKYGVGKLDRVLQVLLEAKALRSDHQMITNFTSGEGYSTPLELGSYGRGSERFTRYGREPREYVKRHFREAIDEAEEPDEFVDDAAEVLSRIPSFPTIVSFHIRLDRRDTPVRIDVPSWVFGIDRSLRDLSGFAPLSDVDVDSVLSMLRLLFGGIRHYNVLLTSVDSEVRLKRDVVDRIYLPLLEKSLGLPQPLAHVRGYRRGWYVR
jgi:hypothetical protein